MMKRTVPSKNSAFVRASATAKVVKTSPTKKNPRAGVSMRSKSPLLATLTSSNNLM